MQARIICTMLLALGLARSAWAEPVWVGRFSDADTAIPAPWVIERLNETESGESYVLS